MVANAWCVQVPEKFRFAKTEERKEREERKKQSAVKTEGGSDREASLVGQLDLEFTSNLFDESEFEL